MSVTVRQRRRVVELDPTPEEVAAIKANQPAAVHEGFILVQRTAYKRTEEAIETVQVPLFATEVARIRLTGATTRNLGDFNSARVEVTIEVPCYPEREEIERAYTFCTELIDEIMPVELQKAGVIMEGQEQT